MVETKFRPIPITILCIVLFLAAVVGLAAAGYSYFAFPLGRALYITLANAVTLLATVGLWRMQRWGVYLYLGWYVFATVIYFLVPPEGRLSGSLFSVALVSIPLAYCAVVFPYWGRFSGHDMPTNSQKAA